MLIRGLSGFCRAGRKKTGRNRSRKLAAGTNMVPVSALSADMDTMGGKIMQEQQYPLSGIRVVELGTHVAVPCATRFLADWGADVIKVENLSGDQWRVVGRNQMCPVLDEENPFFDLQNANKKFVALNLKSAMGLSALMRLLEDADIFVSNMRLPALRKLNVDYETLKERFPRLIYGHFTGYGYEGPDAEKPGFDSVAFWARSGAMTDWGVKDAFPIMPPTGAGDMMAGSILCCGLLAALQGRSATGHGCFVSNSLLGSAVWYNSAGVVSTQYGNTFPKEAGRPANPLGYQYQCADGEWVMIGVADYNGVYPQVCDALGLEKYKEDPRFCRIDQVKLHVDAFVAILREAFSKLSRDEAIAALSRHNIVCGKIAHMRDLWSDPQVLANGYVRPVNFQNGHSALYPEVPVRFEGYAAKTGAPAKPVGADTREVLESVGYTALEIERGAADGSLKGAQP